MPRKLIEPEVQQDATDNLPPPGYAREEELRKRRDALMLQVEELTDLLNMGGIDPKKLDKKEVPREVMAAMDFANSEVYVSNADPNYRYAWIYRDPRHVYGNRSVRQMQARGFECVMGNMKEAKEHAIGTAGERFVSDCVLMRTRLDNYARLRLYDRQLRQQRHDGITSSFYDAANKAGVRVFDQNSMPSHIQQYMESTSASRPRRQAAPQRGGMTVPPARVLRQQAAKRLAMDQLANRLKDGTIPGLSPEDVTRR